MKLRFEILSLVFYTSVRPTCGTHSLNDDRVAFHDYFACLRVSKGPLQRVCQVNVRILYLCFHRESNMLPTLFQGLEITPF